MTTMRKGSALLTALFIIMVLSVMVMSFSYEARMQTGINVFVRERNRVNRLMDAGQALGEVVMVGYGEAKEWSADENLEELLEDDRWYREKQDLKYRSKCTVGPILLDEQDPESGTVTVEIELANAGEKNAINVNELYEGGDSNWRLRWEMLLRSHGVPDEEFEVRDEDGKKVNFMGLLIACWNDWRDDNDVTTAIDGEELGAESAWYEEFEEDNDIEDEDRRRPRNGQIPDIQELGYVRGFRSYPAVLTGGLVYPDQEESEENPRLRGIVDILGTTGSAKINVNSCTVDQLLTVPGIFDEEDDEAGPEIAQLIVDGLRIMPEDYEVDETRDWWPYRDWNDLTSRVDEDIGSEASNYLIYTPDDSSIFKVRIVGESMGIRHEVNAEAYVKDGKVRYIKWRED